MSKVVTDQFQKKVIDFLVSGGGTDMLGQSDNPPKLALFTNDVNPGRDSAYADFVEPTFAGYAPIEFAPPVDLYKNPSTGEWVIDISGDSTFQASAEVDPPQTVKGMFLYHSTGVSQVGVIWAEKFDEPITIGNQYDGFTPDTKLVALNSPYA